MNCITLFTLIVYSIDSIMIYSVWCILRVKYILLTVYCENKIKYIKIRCSFNQGHI